mgnify:CR=1 FL=1
MSRTMVEALRYGFSKNLDYGSRLLSDLAEPQMIEQPAPGMNHPAWILSHLNIYHPVMLNLLEGKTFPDPKTHPFGMDSKPGTNPAEYEPKEVLVRTFVQGHERALAALQKCDSSALEAEVSLERWKLTMPKVGVCLSYLMLVHENVHLGQISAWRRAMQLPPV